MKHDELEKYTMKIDSCIASQLPSDPVEPIKTPEQHTAAIHQIGMMDLLYNDFEMQKYCNSTTLGTAKHHSDRAYKHAIQSIHSRIAELRTAIHHYRESLNDD